MFKMKPKTNKNTNGYYANNNKRIDFKTNQISANFQINEGCHPQISFFTFFMIPLTIYVNSPLMVLFEDDGRRSCRRNP